MASDALHTLIFNLSKNEKRYFRLFASSFKEHSKLLELFDELEKVPINVSLAEKGNSANRSLLRSLILKSMRLYHERSNSQSTLRNALSEIEFLMSKQLYGEAEKEIRKARKLATELHDHQTRLDLLLKANEIRGTFGTEEMLSTEFKVRRDQAEQHAANLTNYAQLKLLNTEWNLYLHQFGRSGPSAGKAYFEQHIAPNIATEAMNLHQTL